MARIMKGMLKLAGFCALCFALFVFTAAWFEIYVGSERAETIADGYKDGRIAGLGKIVEVYCNYLTFDGLRTTVERNVTTNNGRPDDPQCPRRFPRPFASKPGTIG
jgi:hypothetical protein